MLFLGLERKRSTPSSRALRSAKRITLIFKIPSWFIKIVSRCYLNLMRNEESAAINSKYLLFLVSPSINEMIERYIMFECLEFSFEVMQRFSEMREISPWSNSFAKRDSSMRVNSNAIMVTRF